MTVATAYQKKRSDPDITLSGTSLAPPTIKGASLTPITTNDTYIPWPAGTVAGDIAVFICSSGWDFDGGGSSIYPGYNEFQYIGGGGTPSSLWTVYKVLTPAEITAGSARIRASGSINGAIAMVVLDKDENPSVSFIQTVRPTSTTSPVSISLAGSGENDIFMVFGAIEDPASVDFTIAPEDFEVLQPAVGHAGFHAKFGLYSPTGRTGAETITYGTPANSWGNTNAVLRLSRGPQDTGLSVSSSAQATATVADRAITGPVYWETTIDALVGTMGIGVAAGDWDANQILGYDRRAFCYRNNGQVVVNNAVLATISNFVQGDRVDIAFHPGSMQVWFRVNGGDWNNDGTANPSTFTGAIELNPRMKLDDGNCFNARNCYPALLFSTSGGVMTSNFATASFVGTPPTGYDSIEEVVIHGPVMTAFEETLSFLGDPPADVREWFVRAELPEDNHPKTIAFPAGPVKTIAGEVRENDVGVNGRLVRLYNRRTGELVGEIRTTGTGDFVIPAGDPNAAHFVIAFDDDISPDYNAKIYDNVVPQ
jgi:hypothetical protein